MIPKADTTLAETQQKSQAAFNQGRIAKPLRGGGGQSSQQGQQQSQAYLQQQRERQDSVQGQPGQALYQTLAAGSSPLARVQGEEGGKRRQFCLA